jgi:DnaA-homolog protein
VKGLQLPLGVQLSDTASFETFHAGPNAEAVAALQAMLDGAAPPLLFLFGTRASGKTHLLQALTRAGAASRACAYLPLAQLHDAEPGEIVEGLDRADVVCLDDVDAVLDRPGWPVALLRLLDGIRAHGGRCVVTAQAPPERLAPALPDLRSRLAAAAIYGLKPLTDDDRTRVLLDRARARGLELPPDAARYLLARLPRDAGSLIGALDRLDRALLTAQRRLTLAFVQQWLRDHAGEQPPGVD